MNEIPLNIYVEDKFKSTITPLRCVVHGRMTIEAFKRFISMEKRFPLQYQFVLARGQLRKENETFSSIGLQPNMKAENICLFLSKSLEDFQFGHIVDALTRRHLQGDMLTARIVAWTCLFCTALNEPTRPGCEQCGGNMPADYVIPPNYTATPTEQRRMDKEKKVEEERLKREKAEREQRKKMAEQRFDSHLRAAENDPLYFFNTEEFECPICMADIPPGEGVVLRCCAHMFCKVCIGNYIANIEEGIVKCPVAECDEVMEDREIRGVSTPEAYQRYQDICDRLAQNDCEYKVHCKTPDCKGWAKTFDQANGTFDCARCKAKTCIPCDLIHHPMTCKEYQDDIRLKAQNDATKKNDLQKLENMVVNKEAIKCPQCKMIIIKNGGCDGFQCLTCKTWLCWATKGPRWGPNGRGDLSGGCQCGVNGKKCHPKCKYCH